MRTRLIIMLFGLFLGLTASTGIDASGPELSIDPADIGPFVDGVLTEQLMGDSIAGATVTVVHNGAFLYEKGYGLADVAGNVAVTPDTLFRVGSITKLFTWIAVLQQVEQGRIDLDADMNTYLDFEIPAAFDGEPITMRHLMAHTAGFEDQTYGLEAADLDSLKPTGEWLKIHLPARIYRPGETMAYSNYGTALAGYAVERVSGQSYAAYVAEHIFQPLGMTHATMNQPVPATLQPSLAKPYQTAEMKFVEGPFELFHPVPAGAASISGHDMGRFMLAILDDGGGILQPETVDMMLSPLYRLDPAVNGYTYGWMEYDQGDERIVGHAGDTAFFHSFMILVPERKLGLFVSYNTAEVMTQPYLLAEGVIQRYLSIEQAFVPAPAIDLAPYAGTYRMARHNETTAEKLLQLAMTFEFSVDGDELVLDGLLGGDRFKAVSPTVFHSVLTTQKVAFRLDAAGNPTGAMLGNIPITVLEPLPWYATPTFTLAGLGLVLLLYVATLIAAVVDGVQRRIEGRPIAKKAGRLRVPIYILIVLTFALLLGFALPLSSTLDVMTGSIALYRYIVWIPWLIAGVTTWAVVNTWQVWDKRQNTISLLGRWHYTFLVCAALFFIWWMFFWRFFGGMPAV